MEPADFRAMVEAIRELELALGDGDKRPVGGEADERTWARRAIYAARPLAAGTVIDARDVKIVRPALGLPPAALTTVVGRRVGRALDADEPLRPGDCA
jgi:sialic acid synthase SpsE